ncbi:hypothetical protein ABI59_07075 [Acidobacteria bacterium Mor1]|nr:hypothetical protein ABI59_07075 [Acidobacteria bacterium Mor1]
MNPWKLILSRRPLAALLVVLLLAGTLAVAKDGRDAYDQGTRYMDRGRYPEAVDAFDSAIEDGYRKDASMYWKAYCLHRSGRTDQALDVLNSLRSKYPDSRWADEAKEQETEIRSEYNSGTAGTVRDDSLKLIALQSLLMSNPDQGIPILKKYLRSDRTSEEKVKALYLLVQSGSEEAVAMSAEIAMESDDPELQLAAIRNLGIFGGPQSERQLEDLYWNSPNRDVKRRILQSFQISGAVEPVVRVLEEEPSAELRADAIQTLGVMGATGILDRYYVKETSEENKARILNAYMIAGAHKQVLQAAQSEPSADLRARAVNLLGVLGATDDLWTLFQQEKDIEIKKRILNAFGIAGDGKHLREIASRDSEPLELRRAAVQGLGIAGQCPALADLYGKSKEYELRRGILQAIMICGDAKALIRIAREEDDPELKAAAVRNLGNIGSPEATQFLMELLNEK